MVNMKILSNNISLNENIVVTYVGENIRRTSTLAQSCELV